MNSLIGNIILLFCFFFNSFAQKNFLPVVPQPKEVKINSGFFSLQKNQLTLQRFCNENESIDIVVKEINDDFKLIYNKDLFANNSIAKFIFGIPSKNKKFREICSQLNLIPGQEIGEEGYLLFIDTNRIVLSANTERGLFYGFQTFRQLIKGSADEKRINSLVIKDYPSFKFRGVMDDISRGPIPTLDFMKYQIRRLAELKVNVLSHYVEHVVKTKKHPSIAPDDGSLSIDEWKEISDYAKKYFITIVGSFQSFGHFQSILKNPDYAHLGESGSLISPVKEESYEFLKDIYDEMIPIFDAPFFNVNCDETFDLGKAESKPLVDSIGYDGVYLKHILRLNNLIKTHGRRMAIWGDIILEYPGLLSKIPKDVIVGTWTYDEHDSFQRYIKPFAENGFEFFVSPGVLNSNKIFPNYKTTFSNIKKFVAEGKYGGAFGVLNCVWDDGGTALFTNDWFGVAYGAEKSWNHNSSDTDFDKRFSQACYGSSDLFLTKSIWKLNELTLFELTDGMTDRILFTNLVPSVNKESKISVIDLNKILQIIDEADKFLKKTNIIFYKTDIDYLQFVINLYRFLFKERHTLIEVAKYYKQAVDLNEKDAFATRKLILSVLENIQQLIFETELVKSNYEKLWLFENHTYSLELITQKYQRKIDEYRDVKFRLMNSFKRIDSGLPILSSSDCRLAIFELNGKYFCEWLMVNPIPKKDDLTLSSVDYLKEMGGELNAEPKVAEEFYFDSEKYRWRRVSSEYSDVINLSEIFTEKNQNVVTYAFANISSQKDCEVDALVFADDALEVIINGKSVFNNQRIDKISELEQQFKLPLKKGKNNLMLKISQNNGDWKFSFRLPNSNVRNSKNRYRIIDEGF